MRLVLFSAETDGLQLAQSTALSAIAVEFHGGSRVEDFKLILSFISDLAKLLEGDLADEITIAETKTGIHRLGTANLVSDSALRIVLAVLKAHGQQV